MGRYVRKRADNQEADIVDFKIRTRAMSKRMKINVISSTSASYNVYDLRSSRRRQPRSSFASCPTETTPFEEFTPVSCSSSNLSEIAGNYQVESKSEASLVDCSLTSRSIEMKKIEEAEMEVLDDSERKSRVGLMMPLQSEIDEFFSSAEKQLQKCFSDKYNFDVGKEVALEGRYEWVQVTP